MVAQSDSPEPDKVPPLRRGWTTGACATAATKSALTALLTRQFDDPVTITLPGGQTPAFALAHERLGGDFAEAGIVKDAGDDPDVTHGATIVSMVRHSTPGSGIVFKAGPGVGTVTKPGLPIGVGNPAINPVPREMMTGVVNALCALHEIPPDFEITISVPGGEDLAKKTWNPRLGIVGGLSILGTTGIVIPYSCSAWIHSIHRGVDVARAAGLTHIVGSTGDRSEQAARRELGLPDEAYVDMGDFVGGMLKYLRSHPVERVTISGGFAKISKLANGAMDLHSGRSQVDIAHLAILLAELGANDELLDKVRQCESAAEVLVLATGMQLPLARRVAQLAAEQAKSILGVHQTKAGMLQIQVGIMTVNRQGDIIGKSI